MSRQESGDETNRMWFGRLQPRDGGVVDGGSCNECRLPGGSEELHAALLRDGGAAAEMASSLSGEKVRLGGPLFSLSVPSSFSQPACGPLWCLPPSAVGHKEQETAESSVSHMSHQQSRQTQITITLLIAPFKNRFLKSSQNQQLDITLHKTF